MEKNKISPCVSIVSMLKPGQSHLEYFTKYSMIFKNTDANSIVSLYETYSNLDTFLNSSYYKGVSEDKLTLVDSFLNNPKVQSYCEGHSCRALFSSYVDTKPYGKFGVCNLCPYSTKYANGRSELEETLVSYLFNSADISFANAFNDKQIFQHLSSHIITCYEPFITRPLCGMLYKYLSVALLNPATLHELRQNMTMHYRSRMENFFRGTFNMEFNEQEAKLICSYMTKLFSKGKAITKQEALEALNQLKSAYSYSPTIKAPEGGKSESKGKTKTVKDDSASAAPKLPSYISNIEGVDVGKVKVNSVLMDLMDGLPPEDVVTSDVSVVEDASTDFVESIVEDVPVDVTEDSLVSAEGVVSDEEVSSVDDISEDIVSDEVLTDNIPVEDGEDIVVEDITTINDVPMDAPDEPVIDVVLSDIVAPVIDEVEVFSEDTAENVTSDIPMENTGDVAEGIVVDEALGDDIAMDEDVVTASYSEDVDTAAGVYSFEYTESAPTTLSFSFDDLVSDVAEPLEDVVTDEGAIDGFSFSFEDLIAEESDIDSIPIVHPKEEVSLPIVEREPEKVKRTFENGNILLPEVAMLPISDMVTVVSDLSSTAKLLGAISGMRPVALECMDSGIVVYSFSSKQAFYIKDELSALKDLLRDSSRVKICLNKTLLLSYLRGYNIECSSLVGLATMYSVINPGEINVMDMFAGMYFVSDDTLLSLLNCYEVLYYKLTSQMGEYGELYTVYDSYLSGLSYADSLVYGIGRVEFLAKEQPGNNTFTVSVPAAYFDNQFTPKDLYVGLIACLYDAHAFDRYKCFVAGCEDNLFYLSVPADNKGIVFDLLSDGIRHIYGKAKGTMALDFNISIK